MPRRSPSSAHSSRLRPTPALWVPGLVLGLVAAACGGHVEKSPARPEAAATGAGVSAKPRSANCPARAPAPRQLPNTRPELSQLAYWLGQSSERELDEPLLTPEDIRAHDDALREAADGAPRAVDLTRVLSSEELTNELALRLSAFS